MLMVMRFARHLVTLGYCASVASNARELELFPGVFKSWIWAMWKSGYFQVVTVEKIVGVIAKFCMILQ
jgi:hypothetical protein